MATISAAIPGSDVAIAAQRKWRWAAILLQVESLGALLMGALYLLRSTATVSPVPAFMGLIAASLLFPLGTAIERGSRGAGLGLAVMYSLRALQAVLAPPSVLFRMAPLLLVEGLVFGRAILAMANPAAPLPQPSKSQRMRNFLVTILPIGIAIFLFSWGPLRYQNAVIGNATPDEARTIVHGLGWLLVVAGVVLALVHQLPSRIAVAISGRGFAISAIPVRIGKRLPWTLQVWVDFAIAALTLGVSLWFLGWFGDVASQPGAMLVPGVLIFPIVALLCVPLGVVWIVVGVAEIRGKPWAMKLRIAAALPLLLVLVLALPLIQDLILSAVRARASRP